ncbi:cell wall hydrolase [Sphingomonas sp. So64.6b]|uniref:cell wall hydrolase n=1 Tax=Sphingomonas sp. So64.6b TaxID=2997354 RepID=UPI0016041694|nr:cell wall hydrolase [Sphingomonas sp. So64.6b]
MTESHTAIRARIVASPSIAIRLLLATLAIAALVVPALIVIFAPPVRPYRHIAMPPQRVVPQTEIPAVEPLKYQDLPPDDARSFNATIPYSTAPNPAARPFVLTGTDEDKARAIDCMAAAVLYEAGDDTLGQRSVAQVVINRTRHPAFPKTICGVVFQGQERATGCQFTFTCDGALARHRWSDLAWKRARETAVLALTGSVFKPVGYSTHYHTDWVVPYWSSSLDKVTKVRTHLFFRWTGWWGTPPAFGRRVLSAEPVIAQLAALSDAHRMGAALDEAAAATIEAAAVSGTLPPPIAADTNSFIVTLDPKMPPESFAALASATCGERPYCKFMAWSSKAKTPAALPLQSSQVSTMSFSYLRDRTKGYDKALWNCAEYRRPDLTQCMKIQVFVPVVRQTDGFRLENLPGARVVPPPVARTVKATPDGLSGIRRRVEITATPAKPGPQPTTAPVSRP